MPDDAVLQRLFGLRARCRGSERLHNEKMELTLDNGSVCRRNCYVTCLMAHKEDATRRGTRENPATSYVVAPARGTRLSELRKIDFEVCPLLTAEN